VTVASVTVVTMSLPSIYESSATLMIKFGREYVYLPEVGNNYGPENFFNRDTIINAEIEILTNKDLLKKLVQMIGVKNLYPELMLDLSHSAVPLQLAVEKFSKNLYVNGKSNLINVAYQNSNPDIAAKAVNILLELFQEKHSMAFSDPKTSTFFEEKVKDYQNRLAFSQKKLEDYKRDNSAYSVNLQQELLLRQKSNLEELSETAHREIEALKTRLFFLKKQMRNISERAPLYSETDRYDIIDSTKKELLTLQLKEQDFLGKYNKNSSQLINVRRSIKLVEEFLKEQEEKMTAKITIGKNSIYEEIERDIIQTEAELNSHKAKAEIIKNQLEDLDKYLQNLIVTERELRDISREVNSNELTYQTYRKKLEESHIIDEMNNRKINNIRVVQPPSITAIPVKPNKFLNILIGITLGLFAGLCIAVLTEHFNQTLNSKESIEKYVNLPVLTTIGLKN